jgi:hypothetical protein
MLRAPGDQQNIRLLDREVAGSNQTNNDVPRAPHSEGSTFRGGKRLRILDGTPIIDTKRIATIKGYCDRRRFASAQTPGLLDSPEQVELGLLAYGNDFKVPDGNCRAEAILLIRIKVSDLCDHMLRNEATWRMPADQIHPIDLEKVDQNGRIRDQQHGKPVSIWRTPRFGERNKIIRSDI